MKDRSHQDEISGNIKNNELKLMNFCASWSSPCINQFSILEDLSEQLRGSLEIVRVNIDDPGYDYFKYNINAVPTLCLTRKGKEIMRFIGVQQLDTLLERIKFYLETEK